MASNFRVTTHRSPGQLKLRLHGDFDGTSAFELLRAIKANADADRCIVVDTEELGRVYPFGRQVLQKNWSLLNGSRTRIRFVGRLGRRLAPETLTP